MHCEDCVYSELCHIKEKDSYVIGCDDGNPEGLKTNADMIRGMSNDELASFIYSIDTDEYNSFVWINGKEIGDTEEDILKWLNSEVAE